LGYANKLPFIKFSKHPFVRVITRVASWLQTDGRNGFVGVPQTRPCWRWLRGQRIILRLQVAPNMMPSQNDSLVCSYPHIREDGSIISFRNLVLLVYRYC